MGNADYVAVVRTLRYLHEAISGIRSMAMGGEYSEGGLWEADEIITRLEAQIEEAP